MDSENPTAAVRVEIITPVEELSFMDPIIQANLPEFKSVCVPNKDYNNIDKITFTQNINQIFEDTIHWKKNLFSVPTGQAGKDFVKLMTDWVQKFNTDSTFQYLAMKVINILPNMMLQKPSATSKAKDHTKALQLRLQMWNEGKIVQIWRDNKIIQKKLTEKPKKSSHDILRIVTNLNV